MRFCAECGSALSGVWVRYNYDNNAVAETIHITAEDAVRSGPGSFIAFWPYGQKLNTSIKQWESEHTS